jgi:hypothetical protein
MDVTVSVCAGGIFALDFVVLISVVGGVDSDVDDDAEDEFVDTVETVVAGGDDGCLRL